jgi:hypothetical protein
MTMRAASRDRREERRRRTEEAVRASVDSIMRDTRYDVVRGRRVRRGLVVAVAGVLVALLPVYTLLGVVAGTLLAVVGVVVLTLLRQATRIVADAPPELLDERQRAEQGVTYLTAYRLVAGALTLAVLVGFCTVLFSSDPEAFVLTVDVDLMAATSLTVIGALLAVPTAVYAWSADEA